MEVTSLPKHCTDDELTEQDIREIMEARERIKAGEFYTYEEVVKSLGIDV